MKSNTKDRVKLLVLVGVLLVGVLTIWYVFTKDSREVYTNSVKIVMTDDEQEIEKCKKYNMSYAFRINEDGKYFLKYDNGKHNLTKEQYNKLAEGNSYFFNIKYNSSKDTNGVVKEIFTENPVQR